MLIPLIAVPGPTRGAPKMAGAIVIIMLLCLLTGLTTATSLARSKRGLLDIFVPSNVCYDGIGCFSTGGNFYDPTIRPVQFLPWSPQTLDPDFLLFTRSNVLDKSVIKYNDKASVTGSSFNPKKPTKIICHGWTDSGEASWLAEMKKALLTYGDYNVIQLNWSTGSRAIYGQSTANTRVVGALVAQMVMWLEKEFEANREDFHIIGHSLGAHVAGYAGERLRESDSKQLGRITGLDPAGPYFEHTHPEVRLDPTDARFVDAIHTDARSSTFGTFIGLGMMQAVGHVDFYPNGGSSQTGCPKNVPSFQDVLSQGIFGATSNAISCDHLRVTGLFTATVANPGGDFQAYECASYAEFKSGKCLSCSGNRCAKMGIRASEWSPSGRTNVRVWSDTQASYPYYMHHYSVTVGLSSSNFGKQTGDLSVTLVAGNGKSTSAATLVSGGGMEPGQTIQGLVTSADVVDIAKVTLYWKTNTWIQVFNVFNVFGTPKIAIDRVEVIDGASQHSSKFCGNGGNIDSGSTKTLFAC